MTSIVVKHRHHIVPRHAGGTDDPSNLTPPISVRLHAMFHYDRWKALGDPLDWLACRLILSGGAYKRKLTEQARLMSVKSPETREKMRVAKLGKPRVMHISKAEFSEIMRMAATGRKMDPAAIEKIAASKRGTKHTKKTRAQMTKSHRAEWAALTDFQRQERKAAIAAGGGFGSSELAHKAAAARWRK